ncbi:MAG: hypothetical protein RQ899_00510 [Pseudomonadales bacterium]|nr:hypothetical protein [Pseudomonadales bacterium]
MVIKTPAGMIDFQQLAASLLPEKHLSASHQTPRIAWKFISIAFFLGSDG